MHLPNVNRVKGKSSVSTALGLAVRDGTLSKARANALALAYGTVVRVLSATEKVQKEGCGCCGSTN